MENNATTNQQRDQQKQVVVGSNDGDATAQRQRNGNCDGRQWTAMKALTALERGGDGGGAPISDRQRAGARVKGQWPILQQGCLRQRWVGGDDTNKGKGGRRGTQFDEAMRGQHRQRDNQGAGWIDRRGGARPCVAPDHDGIRQEQVYTPIGGIKCCSHRNAAIWLDF